MQTRINARVHRGDFKNGELCRKLIEEWRVASGLAPRKVCSTLGGLIGEDPGVIHRILHSDPKAVAKGYQLTPCPEVARKLEVFFNQPHGTFNGDDQGAPEFPQNGLQPVRPEARPGVYTVLAVNGGDLEEISRGPITSLEFHYLPLDRLGTWGPTVMKFLDPYLHKMAVENRIPILVQRSSNGEVTFIAPISEGNACPMGDDEVLRHLLTESTATPPWKALAHIAAIYEANVGEIMNKLKGEAVLKDQLADFRKAIGDIQTKLEGLGTVALDLLDIQADLKSGDPERALQGATQALASFETTRQSLRQLLRKFS